MYAKCFVLFGTQPSTTIKWWLTNIKTLTFKKKFIDSLLGTMIKSKMIKILSPIFK